jgi:uncharacterized membrane protein YgaE (UPF0421/DUF939 family)
MNNHIKNELSLFSELLLSLLLTLCLGIYCLKTFDPFPWLSFIGVLIGIALIVTCWEEKENQWIFLVSGLLVNTIVWSVFFNWSSFF